jgi:hypothetical protein
LAIATSERINGKLVLSETTREAIKFGAASPSIQYLGGEDTAVNGDGQRDTREVAGGDYVNGISYQWLPTGKWEATKAPYIGANLVKSGADLQIFRQAATGPIVVVGHSVVGGIATTEYRATLSLLKLYYLGKQHGPGLLGSLFSAVDPAPLGSVLALPIEIWADANGNFIQASAQYSKTYPPIERAGTSVSGGTTTLDATYTASNFNSSVHAVVPPTRDIAIRPLQSPTAIAGKVDSSSTHTRAGVLELRITARGILHDTPRFVAVPQSGSWFLYPDISAKDLELIPTFYVDGNTKVRCAPQHVVITAGLTTRNVNLVCSA